MTKVRLGSWYWWKSNFKRYILPLYVIGPLDPLDDQKFKFIIGDKFAHEKLNWNIRIDWVGNYNMIDKQLAPQSFSIGIPSSIEHKAIKMIWENADAIIL